MRRRNFIVRKGFTLIELIIATVASLFIIAGVSVILSDSQKSWNRAYNRAFADAVVDAYIARKTFDSVIRKSSSTKFLVDASGTWLETNYYSDDDTYSPDLYARFYESDGDLNLEYGQVSPRTTTSVHTVCSNVSSCSFKQTGRSAEMMLALDDGSNSMTIVSSAYLHND